MSKVNLRRANRLLESHPALGDLLWYVVHNGEHLEEHDTFNGSTKELRECISRAAYLSNTSFYKPWSEGFVHGFGWSVETIAEKFLEVYDQTDVGKAFQGLLTVKPEEEV